MTTNNERAKELRYYLADNLNAGVQLHEIKRQYDEAEQRGRDAASVNVHTLIGDPVTARRVARTQAIEDCIAALEEWSRDGLHPALDRAMVVRAAVKVLRALLPGKPEGECPDCGGTGDLGAAPDGRLIACETCGGHEDSLGSGRIEGEEA